MPMLRWERSRTHANEAKFRWVNIRGQAGRGKTGAAMQSSLYMCVVFVLIIKSRAHRHKGYPHSRDTKAHTQYNNIKYIHVYFILSHAIALWQCTSSIRYSCALAIPSTPSSRHCITACELNTPCSKCVVFWRTTFRRYRSADKCLTTYFMKEMRCILWRTSEIEVAKPKNFSDDDETSHWKGFLLDLLMKWLVYITLCNTCDMHVNVADLCFVACVQGKRQLHLLPLSKLTHYNYSRKSSLCKFRDPTSNKQKQQTKYNDFSRNKIAAKCTERD